MKKLNTSPKRQARRQRALDRFTISPSGNKDYIARKEQELASLKRALNL